jgi:O-antigen/teichoic acid export membrane protein
MHKLVFKNTLYQVVARLGTSFIGFLITIIIARQFGVIGYGDFTKVTAFVSVFYLFVDFGLNATFLKNENKKFKDVLFVRLVIALILFLICNLIVLLLPYDQVIDKGFSPSLKIAIFIFSFLESFLIFKIFHKL